MCTSKADSLEHPVVESEKHNWKRELSRVTLPFLATGLSIAIAQNQVDKVESRSKIRFLGEAEDYAQYVPLGATYLLKACGVEGRSKWGRLLLSNAFSAALMATFVNSIKYTARSTRPDGSTSNSFPSGHTATAFMAATILHKEYGQTRSPWYSIGGYAIASGVGIMRVLNNRHWVADVMGGAGIGIISTELGYLLTDLIFKDKHTIRTPQAFNEPQREQGFFLSLQLGAGFLLADLSVPESIKAIGGPVRIKKNVSAVTGIEGAYFVNPHVGVGGRFRVSGLPLMPEWSECPHPDKGFSKTTNNQIVNFTLDAGIYGDYPISRWCSIGGKLLVGARFAGNTWYWGDQSGKRADFFQHIDHLLATNGADNDCLPMFSIEGKSAFNLGTELNINFATKGNLVWRINLDYDYSLMPYRGTFGHYHASELRSAVAAAPLQAMAAPQAIANYLYTPERYASAHIKLAQHILGCSVSLSTTF